VPDLIDAPRRMDELREFLDTYSATLAGLPQALPYYALPFVEDPRHHPSFSRVFTASWLRDLQHDLEDFLTLAFRDASLPALYGLWAQSREQGERITSMRQASRSLFDCAVEMMKVLDDVRRAQESGGKQQQRKNSVSVSREFMARMKMELDSCGNQLIGAATEPTHSADVVTGELRDSGTDQFREQELASSAIAEVTNLSRQDVEQTIAPPSEMTQLWDTRSEVSIQHTRLLRATHLLQSVSLA
jgi:hypothetical protein